MSTAVVRLSKTLVNAASEAGKAELRSVESQIEFWAMVGRAAIDNPDLPVNLIVGSLIPMAETKSELPDFPLTQING